jgi:hypothetical protein
MFKGNPFKLRKNRRYNYTPRYFKGKDVGNPYDFDSKFSKYRDTYNSNDFGQQWQQAREKMRHRGNRGMSPTLLVIIVLLVLLFLYIIDFDLSLFRNPFNG